ncbi:MAG: type II toxin-antitoxin system RelE/ParE family toxin [Verrucomicrobiae bacterium]|nr:type II toxin-antitoxin system RelE/ParE family toxin [Verrucomicrobiae bacterium]
MPGQATEVWAKAFQDDLERLPQMVREQVLVKVRELGRRLESFPHERLQGRAEFRLRVGDYRVIYSFELSRNILYLHLVAHRREVYR